MWGRCKQFSQHFLQGIFMGTADVVPGVSGGTIALLLGIYKRLIATLQDAAALLGALLRGQKSDIWDRLRGFEWGFVVPLGMGIVASIAVLAAVIDELLTSEPEAMAGLFFGLVGASVILAWQMVSKPGVLLGVVALGVGGLFFWLLGLQSAPVANPAVLVLFGSGIVAVCAMLLPGISGSFILLILGVYPAAIAAVDDWVWGDLAALVAGAVLGLVLFSNLIGRLLHKWHDPTLAVMVGLLLGSLRVLWPWPNGVGVISRDAAEAVDGTGLGWASVADLWLPTVLALAAFVLVVALSSRMRSSF